MMLSSQKMTAKGKESYAVIDYNFHKIRINNKLADKQSNEMAFLHELLHGIVRERNIELTDEELIVEEIARGLHQVIKDNPEIFGG